MPKFAAGVLRFQNAVYPEKQGLFEQLSSGQSPEALFITCSDSRIETAMITQTEPGELFIIRNAGNIVPPHTEQSDSVTASLEYAAAVLKVPHIVVCGHTECGAMAGAMNPKGLDALAHVKKWLGFAKAAVDVVDALAPNGSPQERMNVLLQQNVLLQLQHLRTHPAVARRLAEKNLELHGWVYNIRTGEVDAWDETEQRFVHIDARYAAEIAKLASAHSHTHAA